MHTDPPLLMVLGQVDEYLVDAQLLGQHLTRWASCKEAVRIGRNGVLIFMPSKTGE
jgi:hypothetical protein